MSINTHLLRAVEPELTPELLNDLNISGEVTEILHTIKTVYRITE